MGSRLTDRGNYGASLGVAPQSRLSNITLADDTGLRYDDSRIEEMYWD